MNFDGNFIARGVIDVGPLQAMVEAESLEQWAGDDFRQRQFKAHRDTETIFLIYDDDLRHVSPTRRERFREYEPLVTPIFTLLSAGICGGGCVRCLLTRLKPGGCIPPHVDRGFSLEHSHRVHVPIVSGGQVEFRVGDEVRNLEEGQLWEINNLRRHSVLNRGTDPRVHLIVDWVGLPEVMVRR